MPIVDTARFRVVATDGLGRPTNATVHSMAYFRGALYVGTSCGNVSGADDTPRILRYDAAKDEWTTLYKLPLEEPNTRSFVPDLNLIKTAKGLEQWSGKRRNRPNGPVPRDVGFRSMYVFKGRSDRHPALYATTMSRPGGVILRCEDGVSFAQVGEVGLGDRNIYSFRGLTGLGTRLFTAPAGTVTDEWLDRNLAPEAKVYVTEDPASGHWVEASEAGFGDPTNAAIYSLCTAHGYVYAGTANPERGYQLWRTAARGKPPFKWEPIIVDGAGAYNHSLAVSAMTEFNGALYVGSGITGFGYDTVHDIGPASAELARVPSKRFLGSNRRPHALHERRSQDTAVAARARPRRFLQLRRLGARGPRWRDLSRDPSMGGVPLARGGCGADRRRLPAMGQRGRRELAARHRGRSRQPGRAGHPNAGLDPVRPGRGHPQP